uniref:Heat shock factor binding protein 1 like 1 n=1 Tax=Anolis carolinensis TaxID=28377 RepID=H9GRZ7_ANOCA
ILRSIQTQKTKMQCSLTFLLDEMGERIDDLEEHVTGLMTQAGIENAGEEIMVRFRLS